MYGEYVESLSDEVESVERLQQRSLPVVHVDCAEVGIWLLAGNGLRHQE